ncbi:hypothetical protein [Adhaeribacter rhizoryzae]|uniref:DUF2493 domain-containing protein n=1 Tax=Adhaeribacter rhizoryzae TaxID=2607907 RepID=A0A5M6D171_9BACT|nr:hypothetical protein [Adhaeribacter rhizoryzae]KAA5538855.1 hypothetical protein F0145_25465 [Adhaeribacter rhizoryzae]
MNQWILFTGHMIDAQDRPEPRFPADKEQAARYEIEKHLIEEKKAATGELKGIAGGACGGDILFHELCLELGIPTEMYLALPSEEFKEASVSFAGKEWDTRFDRLNEQLPVYILPKAKEIDEHNVWERANLWMLDNALQDGGSNMSLIALWDGKGGDGSGGTEHMVQIAKEQGAHINIVNIKEI